MLALLIVSISACFAKEVIKAADLPPGYDLLRATRVAEVDLEGDGKTVVNRRFDGDGRLVELTVTRKNFTPPRVESVTIERGATERRTRVETQGPRVVLRQIEQLAAGGKLVRRETLWDEQSKGFFTSRTVEEPEGSNLVLSKFRREGDSQEWTLLERQTHAGDYAEKRQTPAQKKRAQLKEQAAGRAGGAKNFERYYECVKNRKSGDAASCEVLSGLPLAELQLAEMVVPKYAELACERDGVLSLPNGYGIDLKSCRKKDDPDTEADENAELIDGIRAAVNTATGPMLSCLREVNKPLAQRFALALQERRPTLYCAQEEARFPVKTYCKSSDDGAACEKTMRRHRETEGAFFSETQPNAIFFTRNDPVVDGQHIEDDGSNATLGGILFHETLHACSHSMSPPDAPLELEGHNANPPSFTDAVFGCGGLCGGESERLTRESCVACVGTKVNGQENPDAKRLMQQCQAFPLAEKKRTLKLISEIDSGLDGCERQLSLKQKDSSASTEGCDALESWDIVSKTCGKLHPDNRECRLKLRALTASLARGLYTIGGVAGDAPDEIEAALALDYFELESSQAPTVAVAGGEIKPAVAPLSRKQLAARAIPDAELRLADMVRRDFCAQVATLRDEDDKSYHRTIVLYFGDYQAALLRGASTRLLFLIGLPPNDLESARAMCAAHKGGKS